MVTKREIQRLRKQGLEVQQLDQIWISGRFKGLQFQAQIFDQPSKYGIKKGRTSRLQITRPYANATDVLASFERGWSVRPKGKSAQELSQILSMSSAKPRKRR